MGATLRILRESERARDERKGQQDSRDTRSELFNLADTQVNDESYPEVRHQM